MPAVLTRARPGLGRVVLHRPLFDTVRVHGEAPRESDLVPALLWGGYRQAARLRTWTVHKTRDERTRVARWTLQATVERVDPFAIRQRPLAFVAPRPQNGCWLWPVIGDVQQPSPTTLIATLGPPEF